MIRRILITGLGRSGTGYAAKLFAEMGLTSGHEQVFVDPGKASGPARRLGAWRYEVESSWYAASCAHDSSVLVVQQLRHPLRWMESWISVMPDRVTRWAMSCWELPFEIYQEDRIEALMYLWTHWQGGLRRRADVSYRVEDLTANQLITIVAMSGRNPPRVARARYALKKVPRNVNTRQGVKCSIAWGDLPEGAVRDDFNQLVDLFGYELPGG